MRRGPGWPTAGLMVLAAHPFMTLLAVGAVVAALQWGVEGVLAGAVLGWGQGLVSWVRGNRDLPGPVLTPAEQPELIGLVRRVAERVGFEEPLVVCTLPVPDAVLMPARVHGARVVALGLGLPFLALLTEAQLAALVAHELQHRGHLADRRGSALMMARSVLAERVAEGSVLPGLLGRPLLRRTQPVSFSFELECDRRSAEAVGTRAAREALVETETIGAVFFVLVARWVEQLAEQGQHPADLYDAYFAALADPLVRRRARADVEPPTPVDSHPSTRDRVMALPEHLDGPFGDEPVPVRDLVPHLEAALEDLVDTDLEAVRVLEDPSRVATSAEDAAEAVEELSGAKDLPGLLDAVDAGRLQELPEEARQALAGAAARLLSARLQERGWTPASAWLSSWLVDPAGEAQDLRAVMEGALRGDTSAVRGLL